MLGKSRRAEEKGVRGWIWVLAFVSRILEWVGRWDVPDYAFCFPNHLFVVGGHGFPYAVYATLLECKCEFVDG